MEAMNSSTRSADCLVPGGVGHRRPTWYALMGWSAFVLALVLRGPLDAGSVIASDTSRVARSTTHPISKMTGSAYVSRDRISMRLRFFAEDLYLFHETVEPDEQDRVSPGMLREALEEHRQFLLDRILVLDADGRPLKSQIVDMTDLDVPPEGWSVDQLMEHTVDADLEFTIAEPAEFLTFVQNIVDANFVFPSELELLVRQEGHATVEAKILRPGDPFTMRFVWDRPPLDAAASREEFEQLLEEDREELLGITSYDQLYSFLYITRLEARHEILIPLATLKTLIDIDHDDPNLLSVDEQKAAREVIGEYFSRINPVEIDGLPVGAIVDRVDFYGLDLRDFAQRADPKAVSLASCRVGIILLYPSKQEPREVNLTWDTFNSSIRKVTTIVITGDEVSNVEFSRFQTENVLAWRNPNPDTEPRGVRPLLRAGPPPSRWSVLGLGVFLFALTLSGLIGATVSKWLGAWAVWCSLPIALAAAGGWIDSGYSPPAGSVANSDRAALVRGLLGNVYRAFDYTEDEAIYDALGYSASGDLLTTLYLEIKQGLVVKEQGGAQAVVEQVEIVELKPQVDSGAARGVEVPPEPGFLAKCRWNVSGTIEHWGHVHRRVNQYEAIFAVERIEGDWKLTRMALTDTVALENRQFPRRF
ncbi:MAG: hypothetical protein R3B96_05730 [Pirellulaceae bacterium]